MQNHKQVAEPVFGTVKIGTKMLKIVTTKEKQKKKALEKKGNFKFKTKLHT